MLHSGRAGVSAVGSDPSGASSFCVVCVSTPVEFDVRLVESPDGVRTEGEPQIDLTDF